MKQLTDNDYRELMNAQLKYNNMTMDDVLKEYPKEKNDNGWLGKYAITEQQHDEWRTFYIDYLRKHLKCSKRFAEQSFSYFNLQWGVSTKT